MPGKNRPSRKAKNDRRMAAYIERKERERDQEASGGLDVSGPVEEEEEEEYCFCGAILDWPRARPSDCSFHYFHADCLIRWATREVVRDNFRDVLNKKTCPLCRKTFENIKMQLVRDGEEETVDVDDPVTYDRGGETLAPPASEEEEFPDWDLLRTNVNPNDHQLPMNSRPG